jgi:hypothetical protein
MKFEVYFVVIVYDDEHRGLVVVGNKEEARESSAVTLQVPDISSYHIY